MDLVDLDAGEGIFSKNNIPQEIIDFNQQHNMPIDCIWAITVKEKWRVSESVVKLCFLINILFLH